MRKEKKKKKKAKSDMRAAYLFTLRPAHLFFSRACARSRLVGRLSAGITTRRFVCGRSGSVVSTA
jgi:hypothetical protein